MLSLTLPVTRSEMKREIPTGVFRIPQLFKKKKKANLTTSGYSLVTFSILRVYSVSLVQSKHMQTISSCLWSLHTGAAHTLQANLVLRSLLRGHFLQRLACSSLLSWTGFLAESGRWMTSCPIICIALVVDLCSPAGCATLNSMFAFASCKLSFSMKIVRFDLHPFCQSEYIYYCCVPKSVSDNGLKRRKN